MTRLYTVKAAAKKSGLHFGTLYRWEALKLLKPSYKLENGTRAYTKEDVVRIKAFKQHMKDKR